VALAQERVAGSGVRGLAVALLVLTLLPTIFFVNESTARSGYPFLDAGPARAPDIVYWPAYLPADVRPVGMTIKMGEQGIDMEIQNLLGSGGELRIWESTRYDATAKDAVGPYDEDGRLSGALAVWHSGHMRDARTNLLYARVGQTFVVIVGAVAPEELLRIADSLRRTSPRALML